MARTIKPKPPVINQFTGAVPKDRENVDIHKIDNGYIVRRTGTKGGKYFDSEVYTPKIPKIEVKKPTRSRKSG